MREVGSTAKRGSSARFLQSPQRLTVLHTLQSKPKPHINSESIYAMAGPLISFSPPVCVVSSLERENDCKALGTPRQLRQLN
ncbi:hypothetical protein V2G26_010090 [Clonostachys chloroleuca]